MQYKEISIEKFNHDTILLQNDLIIYFDPFKIDMINMPRADIVFISHHHQDHCNPDDLEKVIKNNTLIVASTNCASILDKFQQEKVFLKPGEGIDYKNVKIKAVPAYNTNKYRAPGQFFHPKEELGLGFLVQLSDVVFYFAGDTDYIPEMANLGEVDIAFLPISGIYVMEVKEALEAVANIRPKIVVPMHYGVVAGTRKQAEDFYKMAEGTEVKILD